MSRRTRNDVTEEVHVNLRVWPNVLTTATGIRPWPNSSRANTRGETQHANFAQSSHFGEMRKGSPNFEKFSFANEVPPNFIKKCAKFWAGANPLPYSMMWAQMWAAQEGLREREPPFAACPEHVTLTSHQIWLGLRT